MVRDVNAGFDRGGVEAGPGAELGGGDVEKLTAGGRDREDGIEREMLQNGDPELGGQAPWASKYLLNVKRHLRARASTRGCVS